MSMAKADIGETYSLKQTRTQILSEILKLQNDTVSAGNTALIDSLELCIISLDEKIFTSYDGSISRMAAQKLERSSNDKLAIYLALGTTAIALFFAFLLLMARSRVQTGGSSGLLEVYRQLTLDLVGSASPEKAGNQRLLRVNVVVLVGLVMMSVSIIAYLLSRL